jgi:hypothetical protein
MPTVKEPVLVAVIGVGGVLVGAADSGLVQALLARAERKRDGRNAARVLSMELYDAKNGRQRTALSYRLRTRRPISRSCG